MVSAFIWLKMWTLFWNICYLVMCNKWKWHGTMERKKKNQQTPSMTMPWKVINDEFFNELQTRNCSHWCMQWMNQKQSTYLLWQYRSIDHWNQYACDNFKFQSHLRKIEHETSFYRCTSMSHGKIDFCLNLILKLIL